MLIYDRYIRRYSVSRHPIWQNYGSNYRTLGAARTSKGMSAAITSCGKIAAQHDRTFALEYD
jgi:hypothetical protein